ncbi:MAG TPA: hypothetical protein VK013_12760 [Myxococcaceae bacterium]|nr:hypothetical protein [Myxococcaceae bacterium]
MSFGDHLASVVKQVDGALACSIMGFDGIAVETHQREGAEELELQATWIEYGNVVSQLKDAAQALKSGEVQEVSVNTERVITIMRLLSPEYFLVLALEATGNYGKGRYALRIAAPKVRSEL